MLFDTVLGLPQLLGVVLVAMLAVMALAWVFQGLTRNTGWVDVFWTFGTGAILAMAALAPLEPTAPASPRQMLVAALVALWALRLGGYIALRVMGSPHEDTRYAGLRQKWGKAYSRNLLGFVLVQAPASTILAVSVILAARDQRPEIGLREAMAVAIWLVAVAGESIADGQMGRFRKDPANKGKVNDRGLWAWSRHPNYFFEWIVWLAYPAIALHLSDPVSWWSLTAPVLMFLILRFGTGVPALERTMLASRGDLWRDYQSRTSAFLLLPPRRKA